MASVKFATQVDEQVLEQLREVAEQTGVSISKIVTDALAAHLQRIRVRPAFVSAVDEVLHDHHKLMQRLAK